LPSTRRNEGAVAHAKRPSHTHDGGASGQYSDQGGSGPQATSGALGGTPAAMPAALACP
jgi:hypothetical protein